MQTIYKVPGGKQGYERRVLGSVAGRIFAGENRLLAQRVAHLYNQTTDILFELDIARHNAPLRDDHLEKAEGHLAEALKSMRTFIRKAETTSVAKKAKSPVGHQLPEGGNYPYPGKRTARSPYETPKRKKTPARRVAKKSNVKVQGRASTAKSLASVVPARTRPKPIQYRKKEV